MMGLVHSLSLPPEPFHLLLISQRAAKQPNHTGAQYCRSHTALNRQPPEMPVLLAKPRQIPTSFPTTITNNSTMPRTRALTQRVQGSREHVIVNGQYRAYHWRSEFIIQ